MIGTLIATTPREAVRPLAFRGIPVAECRARITELVRAHLGEAYITLFAEPVFDAERDCVDWYFLGEGEVRPLSDLPAPDRAAVLEVLAHAGVQLRAAAQALQAADDAGRAAAGCILEQALRYPDESRLYAAAGRPVVTCWGFAPAAAGVPPCDISRPSGSGGPGAAPKRTSDPIAPASGIGVLSWLPFLLLSALLAALLWVGWGGRAPLLPGGPGVQGPDLPFLPDTALREQALTVAREREAALERELAALRDRVERRAALCVPDRPEQALTIPENAIASGDPGFMQGLWRCDAGLGNTASGVPVSVEYAFDASGVGHIRIAGDKGECRSEARALLDDEGRLIIETGELIPCSHGAPYSGQRVICTTTHGRAECRGRNLSSGGRTWDARFYRK